MRVAWWGLVVIALLGWSPCARADSAEVPIAYEAPEACPSLEEFLTSLREHSSESWSQTTQAESSRSFSVEIVQNEHGKFIGRFTSLEHGLPVAERRISARSCNDLAGAMAIVAALAVDAEVRIVTAARRHRAVVMPSPPVRKAPLLPEHPLSVRVAFGGGVTSSLGPVAPTFESSFELAWTSGIRPSFALASSFAGVSASTDPGSVTLIRAAMSALVCPFHTLVGDALDLAPCGSLALGFTRPQVHELVGANETAQPWIAPGVDLRALVWVGDIGVRVSAGLEIPLVQTTYTTNVRPLFATPAVGLDAAISLVIRVR